MWDVRKPGRLPRGPIGKMDRALQDCLKRRETYRKTRRGSTAVSVTRVMVGAGSLELISCTLAPPPGGCVSLGKSFYASVL